MKSRAILSAVLLCLAAVGLDRARAAVTITSIGAGFSNPALTGDVLNRNAPPTPLDNTLSAEFAFEAGGQILRWGSSTIVPVQGFASSAVAFLPGPSPGTVNDGDQFLLGSLLFFNGNSELEKLIFGGDLTITVDASAGGPINPLTLDVGIGTTFNVAADPFWSADFVSFTGAGIPTTSLHAFENAPGILSAKLYGAIDGQTLKGRLIVLDEGQEANGFLGRGHAPVPEASAALVWLSGGATAAGALAWLRRRPA